MFSFGKKLDPKQEARKWKRQLQREIRTIERNIQSISNEEKKAIAEVKKIAKRGGDRNNITPLAKELVRTRHAKNRMFESKTRLNSVAMQLQTQIATMRVAGCLEKSTAVLASMNELMKLPELRNTMREMSMEMQRAGLIDEMVDDTFDMMDEDSIEEDADDEVAKVITELTADILNKADAAPTTALPVAESAANENALKKMKARLEALQ